MSNDEKVEEVNTSQLDLNAETLAEVARGEGHPDVAAAIEMVESKAEANEGEGIDIPHLPIYGSERQLPFILGMIYGAALEHEHSVVVDEDEDGGGDWP